MRSVRSAECARSRRRAGPSRTVRPSLSVVGRDHPPRRLQDHVERRGGVRGRRRSSRPGDGVHDPGAGAGESVRGPHTSRRCLRRPAVGRNRRTHPSCAPPAGAGLAAFPTGRGRHPHVADPSTEGRQHWLYERPAAADAHASGRLRLALDAPPLSGLALAASHRNCYDAAPESYDWTLLGMTGSAGPLSGEGIHSAPATQAMAAPGGGGRSPSCGGRPWWSRQPKAGRSTGGPRIELYIDARIVSGRTGGPNIVGDQAIASYACAPPGGRTATWWRR